MQTFVTIMHKIKRHIIKIKKNSLKLAKLQKKGYITILNHQQIRIGKIKSLSARKIALNSLIKFNKKDI